MLRVLALLCLVLSATPGALAHEISRSHSIWQVDGPRVTMRFTADARTATLLFNLYPDAASIEDAMARQVSGAISVARNGADCAMESPVEIGALGDGRLAVRAVYICAQSDGALDLEIAVFSALSATHLHIAQLEASDGARREVLLSRGHTRARFSPDSAAPQGRGFAAFIALGVTHILEGLDHLAFLAALLLLVRRWRDVIPLSLGFTIGHSITLGLAATGSIAPPGPAVEALIGFSILFVAAEAVLRPDKSAARTGLIAGAVLLAAALISGFTGGNLPAQVWIGLALLVACYGLWMSRGGDVQRVAILVSGLFGLVHGAGFAGILLESGLPEGRVLTTLLGFNIGVEIGQLIALGVAGIGIVLAQRTLAPPVRVQAHGLAVAVIAGMGSYWFLERAFMA
tara:strand:- start:1891 stop:3093 length:1203 start_codon:yes stop_codon:yes gene_type:complete